VLWIGTQSWSKKKRNFGVNLLALLSKFQHSIFPSTLTLNEWKLFTDKLKLTGQNLVQILKFRRDCLHVIQSYYLETKLPDLKLKTRPKQLLGYLRVDIALPDLSFITNRKDITILATKPWTWFLQDFQKQSCPANLISHPILSCPCHCAEWHYAECH